MKEENCENQLSLLAFYEKIGNKMVTLLANDNCIYLIRMKDCGEDMLVDMSEILFNELAFFRLMQDLDG